MGRGGGERERERENIIRHKKASNVCHNCTHTHTHTMTDTHSQHTHIYAHTQLCEFCEIESKVEMSLHTHTLGITNFAVCLVLL